MNHVARADKRNWLGSTPTKRLDGVRRGKGKVGPKDGVVAARVRVRMRWKVNGQVGSQV